MRNRIPFILLSWFFLLCTVLCMSAQQEFGPEQTIRFGDDRNRSARFSPDSTSTVAVANEEYVVLLDGITGDSIRGFLDFTYRPIYSATWSPAGYYLAALAKDTAFAWDSFEWKVNWWPGHSVSHTPIMAWNRYESETVFIADVDSIVREWSLVGLGFQIRFPALVNSLDAHYSLQYSGSHAVVFAALKNGQALFWDLFQEKATTEIWAVEEGRRGAGEAYGALSPDENMIVTSNSAPGSPSEIKLWDRATGDSIGVLRGHTGYPTHFVFSKDGEFLVSGGTDSTARLWRIADRSLVAVFRGHTGKIVDVSLSADGRRLVTISTDSTLRFWNLSTLSAPSRSIAGESGARIHALYPNPAKEEAAVRFSLERSASVRFRLLNDLGKIVVESPETLYASGLHEVPLDLFSVPAGHYLCLLQTDRETVISHLHVVQ